MSFSAPIRNARDRVTGVWSNRFNWNAAAQIVAEGRHWQTSAAVAAILIAIAAFLMARAGSSAGQLVGDYRALTQIVKPAALAPVVTRDPDDDQVLWPAPWPHRPRPSSPAMTICSVSAAIRA